MRRSAIAVALLWIAHQCASSAGQSPAGISAGTDLFALRPYFSDNPAYLRSPSAKTFEWQFERAHSFWADYTSASGWGGRLSAFVIDGDSSRPQLDVAHPGIVAAVPASTGPFAFTTPSPVLRSGLGEDQLWFRSRLRVLDTEYEGTYAWSEGNWLLQVSAGLRYQLIAQVYRADLNNNGDGRTTANLAIRSTNEFVGLGPTLGLSGRYALDEEWSLYGKARGAIAFGTEDRQSLFSGMLSDPDLRVGSGSGRAQGSSRREVEKIVTLTQLEVGVQYTVELGKLTVEYRCGAVAHTYFNAGNAAGGNAAISLFGGQVSMGLRY
jgi:hypothetical protein